MSAMPKASTALTFTVASAGLRAELAMAAVGASARGRSTSSPLVCFRVEAGRLELSASDVDVVFRSSLNASTTGTGAFALDARTLYEILRRLSDGPVRFSTGSRRHVLLSSAEAKFRLHAKEPFEVESSRSPAGMRASVPAAVFCAALDRTAYAMTEEESRYTLAAVRIEIGSGKIRTVATDGRRLALFEQSIDGLGEKTIAFLAPRGTVPVLRKMAARTTGALTFTSRGDWTSVRSDHRELSVRSMAGVFPAYEQIVPSTTVYTMTVPRAEFDLAIRRAALIADPAAPAARLTSGPSSLVVRAERADTGEMTDSVPSVGDSIDVLVSARYIGDFLSRVGGDSIRIGFGDARSAIVLTPVTEAFTTLAVLMPMA